MHAARRRFSILALAAFVLAPAAHAQSIGFDDLACGNIGAAVQVPAGYAGLTWNGFRCYDVTTSGNPGYFAAARTSGTNIAINRGGSGSAITSASTFNFFAARITSSNPDLATSYLFEGWLGSTLLFSQLVASPSDRSLQTFNFVGVDRVELTRTVGAGLFAFDDINVSVPIGVVPEPATTALIGGGMLALGMLARRRRAAR